MMYHNLEKIRKIYKNTFEIKIWDITNLEEIILIRHDLVHRNWKNTESIDSKTLLELCEKVSKFVENIEEQFNNLQD
jgi:hypothetical protein